MKLLRLCAAVALACAVAAPIARADMSPEFGRPGVADCSGSCMVVKAWDRLPLVAQAIPAAPVTQNTPPVTQNTVTTTGPVSSETTISVGTLASQALQWVIAVFGAVLGTAGTALVLRMFKAAGVQISDAARARLQEMIVNGLNVSAKSLESQLVGKGTVQIKNAVVADAVNYVQNHGQETLKQLGIDPNSNLAVDAIKARIETAIADPTQPTPAILNPDPAPKA